VRKRPIFRDEIDNYEFDIVTCVGEDTVVVHDARMHTDMKKQYINHHEFRFDHVFNENADNHEVYMNTAAMLVPVAVNGGKATCLMYGQTGSGKTHTMSSIYERAAWDLFDHLPGDSSVSVSFVELSGEKCSDLFNHFSPAEVMRGASEDSFEAYPVCEPTLSCPEELIELIRYGCNVRSTAATGVHDSSSRSHAVLKIYVRSHRRRLEGCLTLVDLAGTEHRIDSMHHSAARRKEGALINSSLLALKDCIRSHAFGQDMDHHYRKSKLTMMLKESLVDATARTVVIVTVSPASKDTEHSLNSLRHACMMDGQDVTSGGKEKRFITGGIVTREDVGEVDITAIARRNRNIQRSGQKLPGPKTSNGNRPGYSNQGSSGYAFGSPVNSQLHVNEETDKSRGLAERKAAAKLSQDAAALLRRGRREIGNNQVQMDRLGRVPVKRIEKAVNAAKVNPVGVPHQAVRPRKLSDGGVTVTKSVPSRVQSPSVVQGSVKSKHCESRTTQVSSEIASSSSQNNYIAEDNGLERSLVDQYLRRRAKKDGIANPVTDTPAESIGSSMTRASECVAKVRLNRAASLRKQHAKARSRRQTADHARETSPLTGIHPQPWSTAQPHTESDDDTLSKGSDIAEGDGRFGVGGCSPEFDNLPQRRQPSVMTPHNKRNDRNEPDCLNESRCILSDDDTLSTGSDIVACRYPSDRKSSKSVSIPKTKPGKPETKARRNSKSVSREQPRFDKQQWDNSPYLPPDDIPSSKDRIRPDMRYQHGKPFDYPTKSEGAAANGLFFVDISGHTPVPEGGRDRRRKPSHKSSSESCVSQSPPSHPVWSRELAYQRYGNSPLWS